MEASSREWKDPDEDGVVDEDETEWGSSMTPLVPCPAAAGFDGHQAHRRTGVVGSNEAFIGAAARAMPLESHTDHDKVNSVRFEIHVDSGERLVEVTYPDSPSSLETADYLVRMKRIIDQLAQERSASEGWFCLVDQRLMRSMSTPLLEQVTYLNRYALQNGMRRSARVVGEGSAESERQARRIVEATDAAVRTFTCRDAALAWLKAPDA